MLSMASGSALFDTVAIFGTQALVRACESGRCAVGAGVGGRGARPIAMGVAAPACAQFGGVVSMFDGAVTFKGGSISNSTAAVRAPSASCASRAVVWCVARCGTADTWRARCGARMLRRVVYGVRRMRPAWSV